jgi:protease I
MTHRLQNQHVAILATDGFEQAELQGPLELLTEAGADVCIVSPKGNSIQGMHHGEKGDTFDVDMDIESAKPDDFDALVIPGGLMNPDELRSNSEAVALVRKFHAAGKLIAAICHGPWVLIDAGLAYGRKLTSYPSIQTDIRNAGGIWVDKEVVVDRGIITSRNPDDVPAFSEAIMGALEASLAPVPVH